MIAAMNGNGVAALKEERVAEQPRSAPLDQRAFAAFYADTAKPLAAYLTRMTGNVSLAEDLLQESFLRLLGASFEPESESHRRNYLFRIATNLAWDHFRASRRQELPLFPDAAVVDGRDKTGLKRDLGRAMAQLRLRDRQLLWLAHVEEFSHKEIGAILGLKATSIRLMLFRARKRLAAEARKSGLHGETSE